MAAALRAHVVRLQANLLVPKAVHPLKDVARAAMGWNPARLLWGRGLAKAATHVAAALRQKRVSESAVWIDVFHPESSHSVSLTQRFGCNR